ncbi:MAG TPA: NfeD family protein [Thermomicrobiales bacterium]|nr:NfeD family protein [Thermomicrobiales bacterium]
MPAGWSADVVLVLYFLILGCGIVATVGLVFLGEPDEPLPLAPLSPATLAAAVTCFGGAGILAVCLFALSPLLSLAAAALFAVLAAAILYALARVARRADEERAAFADLLGAVARVVAPIEPGHAGQVTTDGARPPLTLLATSRDGAPLPAGTAVVVTALQDGGVEVAPLPGAESGGRAVGQSGG